MYDVLLMLGGGYHPFASCGEIARGFLEETGVFRVETTEDRERLRELDAFDAVVLYTQGGELTGEQERGLVRFVREGGGLVGIHCATDSFVENGDYMELIGSRFSGHGPISEFTVRLNDRAEAIVPRMYEDEFVITDEFYRLEPRARDELTVLMDGEWQFEELPAGYVRGFGAGEVFYTILGHDERAFRHPRFQELVIRGLLHVVGGGRDAVYSFGVVGYGPLFNMGKHHADSIRGTDGLELAAVCDRDPGRLEAAREEQGEVETFESVGEMINAGGIDAGVVVVPHRYHADVALPLLESGLHVVSEKPFAVTVEEVDRMMEAADREGVMLSVYHNRHWDPDILTLLEIVNSGLIGEVFSIECNMAGFGRPGQGWRSHKPVSGGLLYDMGAHQFEKIFQLVKTAYGPEERARTAAAFGTFRKLRWHDVTNEDYCRALLRFDDGPEAQIVQSTTCAAQKPLWTVLGTEGSIVLPDGNGPARVKCYTGGKVVESEYGMVEGGSWGYYYRNIADHLLLGLPLEITPQWARNTIVAIEGCERASGKDGECLAFVI